MKKSFTYHAPVIPSTASRMCNDAYDECVAHFDDKEYSKAIHGLLDFINPELRPKYGNPDGTEFHIPHGSIVVNIKITPDQLKINAPFVALPAENRVPLLREVASLNINALDLACITLHDDKLNFVYECPLALTHPHKIYDILWDICTFGDKYDDEFATKFGAQRIYTPKVTPYDDATIDRVHADMRQTCAECLELLQECETKRYFGDAWNVIAIALMEILYFANPQGQLRNDLNTALNDHHNDDISRPENIAQGKVILQRLQNMSREELAPDLYYVETFVSDKRRSNLNNIQENFQDAYDGATKAIERDDLTCFIPIVYKFYSMYHNLNVQDNINVLIAKALRTTSAMPLEEATPILYRAMKQVMNGQIGNGKVKSNDSGKGVLGALRKLFGN